MTFLPIVGRELRVASRVPATFWSRCGTCGFCILVACLVFAGANRFLPVATVGREIFNTLSSITFFYALMAGIRHTADCLSEEKREGTLGLLFLTDLKGYDVVFGKLFATSLRGFYDLVAVVPVLAVPMLMGGITNKDLIAVTAVLCNTFFVSLAAGMLVSAISKNATKARLFTFILVGIIPVIALICRYSTEYVRQSPTLGMVMDVLNPITCMYSSISFFGSATPPLFWDSVLCIHLAGWFFLAAACRIVPKSWQDKPVSKQQAKRSNALKKFFLGAPEKRANFRRRLLDENAFFWLASRERLRPVAVWFALVALAGLWLWIWIKVGDEWVEGGYFPTVLVLNLVFKLWVTTDAGRRLAEDRKIGALELLLSTPLTIKNIIHGQVLSIKRTFLYPLIAILIIEFSYLLVEMQILGGGRKDEIGALVWFSLAMMFMLILDSIALIFTAMWASLTVSNPSRVAGTAYRNVVALPVFIAMVIFYLYEITTRFGSRSSGDGLIELWLLYAGFGIGFSIFHARRSWGRLNRDFRKVAIERFTIKPSFFKRIFGTVRADIRTAADN